MAWVDVGRGDEVLGGAGDVWVVVTGTGAAVWGAADVDAFDGAGDGERLGEAEVLPVAGGLAGALLTLTLAVAGGAPLVVDPPESLQPATGKTIRAATMRPQALADLFMCTPRVARDEPYEGSNHTAWSCSHHALSRKGPLWRAWNSRPGRLARVLVPAVSPYQGQRLRVTSTPQDRDRTSEDRR